MWFTSDEARWVELKHVKGINIKVFVADDSEIVRERLKAMLSEIPEIGILGEAWVCLVTWIYNNARSWKNCLAEIRLQKFPTSMAFKYIKNFSRVI